MKSAQRFVKLVQGLRGMNWKLREIDEVQESADCTDEASGLEVVQQAHVCDNTQQHPAHLIVLFACYL